MGKFKLCYVEGDDAYFTTAPLTGEGMQWGDDWNDAPYEHNAGPPYEWSKESGKPKYELVHIKWGGDWEAPETDYRNSPYSVESINAGAVPWLKKWGGKQEIPAGTDLLTFIRIIKDSGGSIWLEM
jgi:hypothetical protein